MKKYIPEHKVQRMRNLVTKNFGDKTKIQIGYGKSSDNYSEGDVWEEGGKTWTIKNGITQSVTNFDEIYENSTNSNYEQENFDEKGKNTNIRIRNSLKMLGITSKDQLNEKDINYWWRKRYVYLKHENYPLDEKNKDLIILNNIKDELSKYSLNFIKSFL